MIYTITIFICGAATGIAISVIFVLWADSRQAAALGRYRVEDNASPYEYHQGPPWRTDTNQPVAGVTHWRAVSPEVVQTYRSTDDPTELDQ